MSYLDTRDLYKRQQELIDLRDALTAAREEVETLKADPDHDEDELQEAEDDVTRAETDFGDDEENELKELDELESEVSEWSDGNTMIPESKWEDYCRDLAEDITPGYSQQSEQWPFTCIDWEQAAKELAYDYSVVTYQGEDYYVRS